MNEKYLIEVVDENNNPVAKYTSSIVPVPGDVYATSSVDGVHRTVTSRLLLPWDTNKIIAQTKETFPTKYEKA